MVNLKVYNQLPNEMKHLLFDHIITPAESIKNIQSKINWLNKMKLIEKTFEVPDNLVQGKFKFH